MRSLGRHAGRTARRSVASAASRDVEIFTGEVLGENQRALGLVTAVFAGTRYTLRGGAYHVRMPLRAPGPAANPAGTVPRAA